MLPTTTAEGIKCKGNLSILVLIERPIIWTVPDERQRGQRMGVWCVQNVNLILRDDLKKIIAQFNPHLVSNSFPGDTFIFLNRFYDVSQYSPTLELLLGGILMDPAKDLWLRHPQPFQTNLRSVGSGEKSLYVVLKRSDNLLQVRFYYSQHPDGIIILGTRIKVTKTV